MNYVKLKGNLTKDADFRLLGDRAIPKCSNTIAVNKEYNGKKSVAYINIEAWNQRAEQLSEFKKGQPIEIHGEIVTGSYAKQDGTKVYYTNVQVNKIEGADFVPNTPIFEGAKEVDLDDLPF